jgi:hypothetical protein
VIITLFKLNKEENMMAKETYQPKDTGKLTNFHYASKEDKRDEEILTEHGTEKLDQGLKQE